MSKQKNAQFTPSESSPKNDPPKPHLTLVNSMAAASDGRTQKIDLGPGLEKRDARAANTNPVLIVMDGDKVLKKSFPLSRRHMVIGRDPSLEVSQDICILHEALSRKHAEIIKDKDEYYYIKDLGSTNGTKVNDVPVQAAVRLKEADLITLGMKVTLKFMSSENAELKYYSKLLDSVNRDGMLGIYNKKYLLEFMQTELVRANRLNLDFSMVVLDLDFFKKVNDQHGHDAGDFVLKETTNLIASEVIRQEDVLGRYGGEEFLVILPETNTTKASEVAERIRKAVQQFGFVYQGTKINVTVSLGIASRKPGDSDALAIFKRADQALYESKRLGRNRCSVG